MTPAAALASLRAMADTARAAGMAAYHKLPREYLGVPVPAVDAALRNWPLAPGDHVPLAAALWDSDIHEARIAAARLLARVRGAEEPAAWRLICRWAEGFDGWALADHACIAAHRSLPRHPEWLDEVAAWTCASNLWTRRAALVVTLPWARMAAPTPAELAIRERVLDWAAVYARDREWFMQKAVAWWLRDLSRRDPARVRAFLDAHGVHMKPFARREAARHLA